MKGRVEKAHDHHIPLSSEMLRIFDVLEGFRCDQFVFPSPLISGQPLGEGAMNALLRKPKLDFTIHGFRRSFGNWAREQEEVYISYEAIQLCLAHSIGSKTDQAYFDAALLKQRRALMEAWGNYVAQEPVDTNVVPLFRKSA